MKLQSILLLTGIAAGLMTVSCQVFPSTTEKEAEEFFGRPAPNKAKAEAQEKDAIDLNYYDEVNAHIDRRLNEFNDKDEVKLPVFSSKEARDDFKDFSFIRSANQISLLSMDFAGGGDLTHSYVIDRDSRTLTRTVGDKTETFAFEPFTNGVPRVIPCDAHIIYAFATDFNRIADTVTLRCYEKLEQGENPAIAQLENEANLDKNGKKIDKNFVEIQPKVTYEPIEYRVDNRWCNCYDVKLKSFCSPAVSMAIFVNNEEKTISRLDVLMDDDSKTTFIIDWREQDGIVLPRVIRRLGANPDVFFREDANVILKSTRAAEALAAAIAAAEAEKAAEEPDGEDGSYENDGEEEMVEFDASGDFSEEE